MNEISVHTKCIKEMSPGISAGDMVYLTGVIYTARDAAHKEIFRLMEEKKGLPFDICGAVIYYAGPTGQSRER